MELNLDELEMYIFSLEEMYQEVFTDYLQIKKLLKQDFNVDVTESEISAALDPRIEDEEEDLKILLREFYE